LGGSLGYPPIFLSNMATYYVKRPFDWSDGIKQIGQTVEIYNDRDAKLMAQKGLIHMELYQNKAEKAIKEINNKAYLVHDKGNMFFVKRAGEVIDRLTKKKAQERRDELNANANS
jgi:hypothetical protein